MEENGFYVVKKLEGGHMRVAQLIKGKLILLEKVKFFPNGAIGHPIGTVFEVKNKQLLLKQDEQNNEGETEDMETEVGGEVNGNNQIKKESEEDQTKNELVVEKLRKSGASGEEIVNKLVDKSATFNQKTVYAQDKYLKKKRRVHGDTLVFLKPTMRHLLTIYYKKDTDKCMALRPDLFSRILSASNVQFGSKILLLEQCQGVLTSGILERLGGEGMCVHLHKGSVPQGMPCVDVMRFDQKTMDTFYPVPLSVFFEVGHNLSHNEVCFRKFMKGEPFEVIDSSVEEDKNKVQQRIERRKRTLTALGALREASMSALILSVQYIDSLSALKVLLRFVAPSSPLVIYSMDSDPLLACYKYLRDGDLALDLHLTESFYREHQVLPDRTHPEMSQQVAGGYILYGISVIPKPRVE